MTSQINKSEQKIARESNSGIAEARKNHSKIHTKQLLHLLLSNFGCKKATQKKIDMSITTEKQNVKD